MSEQVINAVNTDELSTLLIPVNGKQLLVPNVLVAEIIGYTAAKPVDRAPEWFQGFVEWRTQPVPLVSFEKLNQQAAADESLNRRIVILNGIFDGGKLPFCALVSDGVPRAMKIKPKEIAALDDVDIGIAEMSAVVVNGEQAFIPNIDWLQEQIISAL